MTRLGDADQILVALWGRQVIKAVFLVGTVLSMFFWAPRLAGGLSALLEPSVSPLAFGTLLLGLNVWKYDREVRDAQKTLDRIEENRLDEN